MKYLWILISICGTMMVGCKSGADAGTTAANSPSTTAGSSAVTAIKGAVSPNAGDGQVAVGKALTGKWTEVDVNQDGPALMQILEFKDDGSFSMTQRRGTTNSATTPGTYALGGPSRELPGGQEIKLTYTDMKSEDPAKQAAVDQFKGAQLKAMNAQPGGAFEIDTDGVLELVTTTGNPPVKFTKSSA